MVYTKKIPLFFILMLLFTSFSFASLVHHYIFDSSSVTDIVGGVHGSLYNGASISNGALLLDGSNDYVELSGKIIPNSGNYTVAFFARQTALQSGGYVEMISQVYSGGPGFYIGHDPSRNMRFSDAWGTPGVAMPGDAQWHHYAFVSSTTSTSFYIDGVLKASTGALSFTTGGTNTRFGSQFVTYGEYFSGMMDDIRIYSHTLSSSELLAISTVPEFHCVGMFMIGVILFLCLYKK